MNVDNNFKVFKYNGIGPVMEQPFDRLYDAMWRPSGKGVYPDRPVSPKKAQPGDTTQSKQQ